MKTRRLKIKTKETWKSDNDERERKGDREEKLKAKMKKKITPGVVLTY